MGKGVVTYSGSHERAQAWAAREAIAPSIVSAAMRRRRFNPKPSRSAVPVEDGAPLIIWLAVAAFAAHG